MYVYGGTYDIFFNTNLTITIDLNVFNFFYECTLLVKVGCTLLFVQEDSFWNSYQKFNFLYMHIYGATYDNCFPTPISL